MTVILETAAVRSARKTSGIRALVKGTRALLVNRNSSAMLEVVADELDGEFIPANAATYPPHHHEIDIESPFVGLFPALDIDAQPAKDVLIVKITSACPLRCTYCYDYEEVNPQVLAKARILSAIAQCLERSTTGLSVLFHGGEPLTEFRLIESVCEEATVLAASLGRHVAFQVQTSGIVINEPIVSLLETYNFGIGLSLDGPPEVNDLIRVLPGNKPSSDVILKQWSRFHERLSHRTGILTTVTSNNVDQLPEIVSYFEQSGFAGIHFSLFHEQGRGVGQSPLHFTAAQFITALRTMIDRAAAGEYQSIRISYLIALIDKLVRPTARHHCRPSDGPCGAANGVTNLQSDGYVTGCDLLRDGQYVLGHIDRDPLSDALSGENAQWTRARFSRLLRCHDCTWKMACGGTCAGSAPSPGEIGERECRIMQDIFEYLAWKLHEGDGLLNYYLKFQSRRADVQSA